MKLWLRRLFIALTSLLLALAVLLLLGLALLQTDWARGRLLDLAKDGLQTQGLALELRGLRGFLPFSVELESLELADPQGPWLSLQDLRFAWSPAALLDGRVRVEELSARRIGVVRVPELPPSQPEPEPEPSEPLTLPQGLPPLVVDHIGLDRIELGADLLGETLVLSLQGQARARPDQRAGFELRLRRLDQESAELTLTSELDLAGKRLDLRLLAEERGGLLDRLLQQPNAGPWLLRLEGAAPWDAWEGRLDLQAAGLAEVESRLQLTSGETPELRWDGGLQLASGLVPPELRTVWDGTARYGLDLRQTGANRLQLAELRLDAGPVQLRGDASLDFDSEALAAQVRLALPELATLAPLAGSELAGSASLDLVLGGSLDDPRADLTLGAKDLHLPGAEMAALENRVSARLQRPLSQGEMRLALTGGGRAEGLKLADLPQLGEQRLDWVLDLAAPAAGPVELNRLTLDGGPLHADLTGRIDPQTLAGSLQLSAAWEGLELLAGDPWAGKLALNLEAESDAGLNLLQGTLSARGRGVQGLPPAAVALLGTDPGLSAGFSVHEFKQLLLEQVELQAVAAELSGGARVDFESGVLGGNIRISLPDLAPLGQALASPMAGNLNLDLGLAGSIQAPAVRLRVQSRELQVAGMPLERLDLNLAANDLSTAPSGNLELVLGPEAEALSLSTGFRLQDRQLDLSALRLAGPATELQGELAVDLGGPVLQGGLKGGSRELAALAYWHQVPGLAGPLDLDLRLAPQAGTQHLALNLVSAGLQPAVGRIERLEAEVELRDLFGALGLHLALQGNGFDHPDLPLERLQLGADGSLADLELALGLQGDGELVQALDAVAKLRLKEGETEVELSSLSGQLMRKPLALQRPSRFLAAGDMFEIQPLNLTWGDGSLNVGGGLGATEVALQADIQRLDLAPLMRFAGFPLDGKADAQVELTGTPSVPELDFGLQLGAITWPAARARDLEPASFALTGRIAQGRLRAELATRALAEVPLQASARLPVRFSLQPFDLALSEQAPLAGTLTGKLDLGKVAELLALDNQNLGGLVDADLRINGSALAPGLEGTLALAGGRYENGLAGVLIEDIDLEIQALGRQLTLRRLSAGDGETGSLSGSGQVSLPDNGPLAYRVQLELGQMELVRSPQVTASMSGNLALQGDQHAAQLTGSLTLDQAEILIPDKVGPDVPVLEVTEVHDEKDNRAKRAAQQQGPEFALQLDLALDIPSRAFVRGRGLESEWRGALQVQGEAGEPRVSGGLRVHRGWLDLLDRRFTLAEGRVEFLGDWPPVPDLVIRAESQGKEILGIIEITGPADDPKLTLESQPVLPQDEVLARLLFDRPLNEITPTQAVRLAVALKTLTSGGGGGGVDLMGKARKGLGLDTLDFDASGSDSGSVKAGKYLRDDVYLEVTSGLGSEGSEARVEWDLTPNISVETSVDQESKSSFGLNWKLDY